MYQPIQLIPDHLISYYPNPSCFTHSIPSNIPSYPIPYSISHAISFQSNTIRSYLTQSHLISTHSMASILILPNFIPSHPLEPLFSLPIPFHPNLFQPSYLVTLQHTCTYLFLALLLIPLYSILVKPILSQYMPSYSIPIYSFIATWIFTKNPTVVRHRCAQRCDSENEHSAVAAKASRALWQQR